ncbi:hypothetical protein XA68_11366 [Ophiocordyceps unilateralis]|uniref:AB hydrolase-1 domain-containing protein n=1 Tax=Ophiocordyceps unilateralis TaxID=268505 RepID=A0A2A9P1T6_OPHUN|nr:hypothetical protein XA68_11366 [Ophiocordyceps unilateralis]
MLKDPLTTLGLAYDLHEPTNTSHNQPPIIFLHGLFGSKRNNQSICKVLSRDLNTRVYALDLRNHGDSFHHQDHDYSVMAEDVSTFINDHGLRDATVIGHSMGAKTAMTLALREPDLKNSAIIYVFVPSLPVRQFLLGNLSRADGSPKLSFRIPLDILHRSLGTLGDFPHGHSERQRFVKPSLFIRGTKSGYVKDEMLPFIDQLFPNFQLVEIDAGHWLISEQPEAFRQVVVNFVKVKTKTR